MTRPSLASMILLSALALGTTSCSHLSPSKVYYDPLPQITHSEVQGTSLWKYQSLKGSNKYFNITPIIENDVIYSIDNSGKIIALDKNNGKERWVQKSQLTLTAGPSVIGNLLLVGTNSGEILAYNKFNGELLWQTQVSSEILALPSGNQSLIIISTIDGKLSALDYHSGSVRWIYDKMPPALILRRGSTPLIYKDKVFAGLSNGKLVALNKESGTLIWEKSISEPKGRSELHRMVDIAADPIILNDNLYVATIKGNLAALDINSGDLRWDIELQVAENFTLNDKTLFVVDTKNHILAVDALNGTVLWRQNELKGRPLLSPMSSKKWLIIGDKEGVIYWLDKKTGKLIGTYENKFKLASNLIISDNKLYLQGKNGTLAAIQISKK